MMRLARAVGAALLVAALMLSQPAEARIRFRVRTNSGSFRPPQFEMPSSINWPRDTPVHWNGFQKHEPSIGGVQRHGSDAYSDYIKLHEAVQRYLEHRHAGHTSPSHTRNYPNQQLVKQPYPSVFHQQPKGNWDWLKGAAAASAVSHTKPNLPGISVPVLHQYQDRRGWRGKVGDIFDSSEEDGRLVVVYNGHRIPHNDRKDRRPLCAGRKNCTTSCAVVCTPLPCNNTDGKRCKFTCTAVSCEGIGSLLNMTSHCTGTGGFNNLKTPTVSCNQTEASCNLTQTAIACNNETGTPCNLTQATTLCTNETGASCNSTPPVPCNGTEASCNLTKPAVPCTGTGGSCNFTCTAIPCNATGGFCKFTCPTVPCNVTGGPKNLTCKGFLLNVTMASSNLNCKAVSCNTPAATCNHTCKTVSLKVTSTAPTRKSTTESFTTTIKLFSISATEVTPKESAAPTLNNTGLNWQHSSAESEQHNFARK